MNKNVTGKAKCIFAAMVAVTLLTGMVPYAPTFDTVITANAADENHTDESYFISETGELVLQGALGSIDNIGISKDDVKKITVSPKGAIFPDNSESFFRDFNNVESIDLRGADMSSVGTMDSMFENCQHLKSVNMSGLDTSGVTLMDRMFYMCFGLTSVDLSGFNTSKVVSMKEMFYYCSSLTSVDLSGFDTSNVMYMDRMFYDMFEVETIYAGTKWKVPNPYQTEMFTNCFKLGSDKGCSYAAMQDTSSFYGHADDSRQGSGYLTGKYFVSVDENMEHCTVTVDKTDGFGYYDKVTLTVTPDEGYSIKNISLNPYKYTDDNHDGTYSFSNCDDDVTVSVETVINPAHFSVDETGNIYTIHDAAGWNVFCDCLNDNDTYNRFSRKTVVLENDIAVTRMAGSDGHEFMGTFDGQNHTLNANISGSTGGEAVFYCINGAAVKNLTLSGSITGGQHCAALVGFADGTNTIENVNVTANVNLADSIPANKAHHGGVIGHALSSNTTLRGVIYSGTISSKDYYHTSVNVGGLVGWADSATITIENSIFAGTYNGGTLFHPILCKTGSKTVNGTFTNVYYTAEPTANNLNYYLTDAGKTAHTITAGDDVTLSLSGTATTYNISGITSYANNSGLKYRNTFYAGKDENVSLTLAHSTTPTGYTFKGYTANAGTLDGNTLLMPNQNVVISAVDEANKYNVTWVDGDGNILKTDSVAYGSPPVYSGATPTKKATAQYSYTFSGWGDVKAVTGDVTYTARFSSTVNKYQVTWIDGDGNTLKTDSVAYGNTPAYSGATPTKKATAQYSYTFSSWGDVKTVTENATYTAQFTETVNPYTVTWINTNGQKIKEDTVPFGARCVNDIGAELETPDGFMICWTDGTNIYLFSELPAVKENVTYKAVLAKTLSVGTVFCEGDIVYFGEQYISGAGTQIISVGDIMGSGEPSVTQVPGANGYGLMVIDTPEYNSEHGGYWIKNKGENEKRFWLASENYGTDIDIKVSDGAGTQENPFILEAAYKELSNTSMILSTEVLKGDEVTIIGCAEGGVGEYQYALLYKKKSESKWTVRQNYSDNSEIIVRPYTNTEYDICIKVKDEIGTIAKKYFKVTVYDKLSNTSAISATTILKGDKVTLNGSATGGMGKYTYAVFYKKASETKWTTRQNYSANAEIIVRPYTNTEYDICIKVKDEMENISKKYFKVTVNDKLSNTSAISAVTISKGDKVTLNGSATGGTGEYQYAVLYKKKSESKWTVRQNYNENAEIIVRPYTNTEYDICIKVKDKTGNIAKKFFEVSVK